MIRYDSIREIQELLERYKCSPQKKWGQNFMISQHARKRICSLAGIEPGETVWEIGPGIGSLTALLVKNAARICVFEIDSIFIKILNDQFGNYENFVCIPGNFLKTWESVYKESHPDKIIGNLPYNSGSMMIGRLIEKRVCPAKMVFTVQKEVADRMVASPGSKNYSVFSLICQFRFRVSLKGELKPGTFYPQPKVNSSIVEFSPCSNYSDQINSTVFFQLVHDAFRSRRKTLKNNLLGGNVIRTFGRELLFTAVMENGIDYNARGETLSLEDFVSIVRRISPRDNNELQT